MPTKSETPGFDARDDLTNKEIADLEDQYKIPRGSLAGPLRAELRVIRLYQLYSASSPQAPKAEQKAALENLATCAKALLDALDDLGGEANEGNYQMLLAYSGDESPTGEAWAGDKLTGDILSVYRLAACAAMAASAIKPSRGGPRDQLGWLKRNRLHAVFKEVRGSQRGGRGDFVKDVLKLLRGDGCAALEYLERNTPKNG